ncbi:uncharacterized protein [Aegilops tauschii subsp. strangulata]|uniref:uncharacterized protein n=1 Tax=Aegilops tauschii subsp. strangulata TaxID=200361 RepID=UPI00098B7010|nr:uncharacterized protein LOC109781066 isoform X2 [Aegilops tauschii subsp. strangulata]
MLLLRRRLRHPHRRGQCQIQRRCRIYARAPVATASSVRPTTEEGEEQAQWRRSRQRRRRERSSARGADGGVAGDVWRATTQRSRAAAGRQRGDKCSEEEAMNSVRLLGEVSTMCICQCFMV